MNTVKDKINNLSLWEPQQEAINTILEYIENFKNEENLNALIQMPTGTGKSGVIAVASQMLHDGGVLIVVPRIDLADQLKRTIETGFWQTLKSSIIESKPVVRFTASTLGNALENQSGPTIWITTPHNLQRMHVNDDPNLKKLSNEIKTVIVDEAHYAPAPGWYKAIRQVSKPTIFFTATPYRNDYEKFRINEKYVYVYSHDNAEKDNILRMPTFITIDYTNAEEFCEQLVNLEEEKLNDSELVIVRCTSVESVNKITRILRKRNKKVLAIHEKIDTNKKFNYKNVTDAKDSKYKYKYWVHQHKLTEGIDNPRFRLLGVFENFSNERALVQQIGRILRNPERKKEQKAFIISETRENIENSWNAYRSYLKDHSSTPARTALEIFEAQVGVYVDNQFRAACNPKNLKIEDITFPLSTRVYRWWDTMTLEQFETSVAADVSTYGVIEVLHIKATTNSDNVGVYLYLSISNTDILTNFTFMEPVLCGIFYRKLKNLLFFQDSAGRVPETLKSFRPVSSSALQQVYTETATFQEVGLKNLSSGIKIPSKKIISAGSLNDTIPDLSETSHIVTSITGSSKSLKKKKIKRYVGFKRSRVRDPGKKDVKYYVDWTNKLAGKITSKKNNKSTIFNRWAEELTVITPGTVENILLNLKKNKVVNEKGEEVIIKKLCINIKKGCFNLKINKIKYNIAIKWDKQQLKYVLSCSRLAEGSVLIGKEKQDLLTYFNTTQNFTLVTNEGEGVRHIYIYSCFFRVKILTGPNKSSDTFDVLNVLTPVKNLPNYHTEKGTKNGNNDSWDSASIFGLIDKKGKGTELEEEMKNIDILICDDMQNETADFIAINKKDKRVVSIHAKANKNPKPLSATALQEVFGQVTKNLNYMTMFNDSPPPNWKKWENRWTNSKYTVQERIRVSSGKITKQEALNAFKTSVNDPIFRKEIWVILGNGLSVSKLQENVNKQNCPAQTIQILYSLQALWYHANALNIDLKIFCSP